MSLNVVTGQNFSTSYGAWRFALIDFEKKRVVWRAEVSSRLTTPREQIEAVANEVTEKLNADGLLSDLCRKQQN